MSKTKFYDLELSKCIPPKRDNVIKNKLHEYLRSKKISASSDANEDEQEGLTIDEFIELFKGTSLKETVLTHGVPG